MYTRERDDAATMMTGESNDLEETRKYTRTRIHTGIYARCHAPATFRPTDRSTVDDQLNRQRRVSHVKYRTAVAALSAVDSSRCAIVHVDVAMTSPPPPPPPSVNGEEQQRVVVEEEKEEEEGVIVKSCGRGWGLVRRDDARDCVAAANTGDARRRRARPSLRRSRTTFPTGGHSRHADIQRRRPCTTNDCPRAIPCGFTCA